MEICKNLQIFSKIWGIKTNFGQNRCPNMWKFTLFTLFTLHFNKLSYFFYFMKKSCVVLKICHFKVRNVWIPLKVFNFSFWIDVSRVKSYLKANVVLFQFLKWSFLCYCSHTELHLKLFRGSSIKEYCTSA